MRLWLPELQTEKFYAQKIKTEVDDKQSLKDGWEENADGVLLKDSLLYVSEIIHTELICCHHDDPLIGHFWVEKTQELISQKYYWPTLCHDVEAYIKDCNVYLASKVVRHKPYGDLQFLPVPTH